MSAHGKVYASAPTDAADNPEHLFTPSATYDGSTVIGRLRQWAKDRADRAKAVVLERDQWRHRAKEAEGLLLEVGRELVGRGHLENHGHRQAITACDVCKLVNRVIDNAAATASLVGQEPLPGDERRLEGVQPCTVTMVKDGLPYACGAGVHAGCAQSIHSWRLQPAANASEAEELRRRGLITRELSNGAPTWRLTDAGRETLDDPYPFTDAHRAALRTFDESATPTPGEDPRDRATGWGARKMGWYYRAVGPDRETAKEALDDIPTAPSSGQDRPSSTWLVRLGMVEGLLRRALHNGGNLHMGHEPMCPVSPGAKVVDGVTLLGTEKDLTKCTCWVGEAMRVLGMKSPSESKGEG